MSKLTVLILVLSLILFVILRLQTSNEEYDAREPAGDTRAVRYYTRLSGTHTVVLKDTALQIMRNPLRDRGFRFTTQPDRADLLMFNLQSDYATMYDTVVSLGCPYVYSIRAIDLMAHKGAMYAHLKKTLSPKDLARFLPVTWVITDVEERARLARAFAPSKMYILKKNVQRQKGCKITRDLDTIMRAYKESYVVCQEVITDNYLVNTRKINLRIYVLFVVHKDVRAYMYTNGFVYYGTTNYHDRSDDREAHITTGYVDRQVYKENPLTLTDLYTHIGAADAARLRGSIQRTIQTVVGGFQDAIHDMDAESDCTNFVVTGWDLSVQSDLTCKVMEINKGPDMAIKDDSDGDVKRDMTLQAFRMSGLLTDERPARFVRVSVGYV